MRSGAEDAGRDDNSAADRFIRRTLPVLRLFDCGREVRSTCKRGYCPGDIPNSTLFT